MAGPFGGINRSRPGVATTGCLGMNCRTTVFGGGFSLATAGRRGGID
ncbi:hypothetical protein [Pseudophaeobacter sp.]